MLLAYRDGRSFATGAESYVYRPATTQESTNRLILQIDIEGFMTLAALDTGAPYVICAPDVAQEIGLNRDAAIERARILIRGTWVDGGLHEVSVTFPAEEGEPYTLNATAFVPEVESDEWGSLPSFLASLVAWTRYALPSIRPLIRSSSAHWPMPDSPT
jgi:hypothetical protein